MLDSFSCCLKLPDELQSRTQQVYDIRNADLLVHAEAILQDDLNPLRSFLMSLPPNGIEIALVLRAILLLYTVTAGVMIGTMIEVVWRKPEQILQKISMVSQN